MKLEKADTLVIIGTSLTVYNAAYYLNYFSGKSLVILNETPTSQDGKAQLVIRDNFSKVMIETMKFLNN